MISVFIPLNKYDRRIRPLPTEIPATLLPITSRSYICKHMRIILDVVACIYTTYPNLHLVHIRIISLIGPFKKANFKSRRNIDQPLALAKEPTSLHVSVLAIGVYPLNSIICTILISCIPFFITRIT